MAKFIVHHAVLGVGMATQPQPMVERADLIRPIRKRWLGENGLQFCTAPAMSGDGPHSRRARASLKWDSSYRGNEPRRALGYTIKVYFEGDAFEEPGERTYWVETMYWDDNSEERTQHRELHGGDPRCCFARCHAILWPSREHADRHRDHVPFVDPATLDPCLKVAPTPVCLEDDPCDVCGGSGHRVDPSPLADLREALDLARATAQRLRTVLEELIDLGSLKETFRARVDSYVQDVAASGDTRRQQRLLALFRDAPAREGSEETE